MYSQADFKIDCEELYTMTGGNIVNIPGKGEVLLYDPPLIGFAAASDAIFERYRQPEIIGQNYLHPSEWLPEAKTVAAFFFPFSERVRVSNRDDRMEPSPEWCYARVEGQEFIMKFMTGLQQRLRSRNIECCVPPADERFGIKFEPSLTGGEDDFHVDSRWSERHAAYACGLGTFGLSRGLISEKGMAGRYASIIISEEWEPSGRKYRGVDDYCSRCGACVQKCPVNAISLERGKNNIRCHAYVEKMKEKYAPRYGCGKCQVGVPCEFRIPRSNAVQE